MTIQFCTRCVISNMRPRITFDSEGVCSACRFAEKKAATDWAQRERELAELCAKHRKGNGDFDVIVPCSGGKDGGYVAHQLKHRYGMTPLCVSWAPLLPTDIGRQNLDAFVASGFDVIVGRPNGQTARKLARLAFEHMGDVFQPFILGQTNFPQQIAVRFNVPLIMWGEDGELHYGGHVKEARAQRPASADEYTYFSGKGVDFWEQHGVSAKDLIPFRAPALEQIRSAGIESHFFSYYVDWIPQENFYTCVENTGFKPNTERTVGTWSKYASLDDEADFLHYYMAYIKFGIGRATSDASHEIRDGHISREEAVALVKKYDGEFSDRHWKLALDYMGMSDEGGRAVIEQWKSPEVWLEGQLRSAVWM